VRSPTPLCCAANVAGISQLTEALADMEVCQATLGAQSPHRAVSSALVCMEHTRIPAVSLSAWSAT